MSRRRSRRSEGGRLPSSAAWSTRSASLGTALGCCLALACATSATGRKQLLLMPEDQLSEMGSRAFLSLKSEEPIEESPATNQYVRCVAGQLLEELGLDARQWEVVTFEDEAANAFALPGGKIGVFTGLLDVATTQDQLAAVLAHEIAHVTQQHGNERVSQAFVAEGGLAAASLALDGEGQGRQLALAALGLGAQYGVLMPFGRAQESEADEVGLEYMARAGFDPRAAVTLWKNMAEAGGQSPPEFLSTHPSHESRIEDLRENMDEALSEYREALSRGEAPHCSSERVSLRPDSGLRGSGGR